MFVCVQHRDSNQTILTKLCIQIFERLTSVEFVNWENWLNRFKMAAFLNISKTIKFVQLIIFEN